MDKLTKKKCIKSLKELSRIRCLAREEYDREEDAIIMLRRLINEHFDNKPYKFDELEEGMWVWDNEGERYFKIFDTIIDGGNRFVVTNFSGFSSMLAYRPKRFYPREVK